MILLSLPGFFVGKGRHHNDFDTGLQLARGTQELDAAHVGHLHIGNNDVGRLLAQQSHRLTTVLSDADCVPVTLEQVRQELTHAEFVVDYKEVGHKANAILVLSA